ANATYFDSHGTDQSQRVIYAMDLSTLIAEPTVDIVDYVISAIDRFREDVRASLERQLGRR
ncbi:MAG TPA: PIG-L family deacetylase, partial [Planctomycetota bacterium]|nr:PIG-L family deacetylase [Planctomycetota bacterium]